MIPLESLQLKLSVLQDQLNQNLPGYKSSLEDIRNILQRDPEQLHLLRPDGELSVLFAAMANFKEIEIPIAAAKKEKEKIIPKNLSLNDF